MERIPFTDKRASRTGSEELEPVPANASADADTTEGVDVAALQKELDAAWKRAGQLEAERSKLEREVAHRVGEYQQLRVRTDREKADLESKVAGEVVLKLLPVLDDFDRSLDAAKLVDGAAGVVDGLELVRKSFVELLTSLGVERIDQAGVAFDSNQHEAVATAPGEVESESVSEVVRPGYRLGDRVLRAAMVIVATPQ